MDLILKNKIPAEQMTALAEISSVFKNAGYQSFVVGGSVRDLILGFEVSDYDFATDARPEQVISLFKKTVPTGIKHGTVTVLLNGLTFEVTTFRADGKYIDGRRPERVSFSKTLAEDVKRRDFTINGLAYDVLQGKVLDLVNGLDDISAGIIRTIGDPVDRFSEDGLRPYRACRFAARLKFSIEDETLAAITKTLDIAKLVSAERIRDELLKLLEADVPSDGFDCMRRSGLLDIVLPELASTYDMEQNKYHLHDIYHHCVYSCDAAPKQDPIMRLSALLHDIGKSPSRRLSDSGEFTFYNHEVIGSKTAKKIMKRLKFSNEQIERVANLVSNHMFHYTDEWTDGAVRRFMRKVGMDNLSDLFTLRIADRVGNGARSGLPAPITILKERIQKVIDEENAITVKDLKINGHDIMNAFDIKPGPAIGIILNELLELVLDDPAANEFENLMTHAKRIFKEKIIDL